MPAHAAAMHEATAVGWAAGYTAFDGEPPADAGHFAVAAEYAHATAPLRRLQDRYVAECCLAACAGTPVPDWVRAALPDLPAAMTAGAQRAGRVERGVVDLVEAAILAGREGERFDAVVIEDGVVQLRDPAVRGRLVGRRPAARPRGLGAPREGRPGDPDGAVRGGLNAGRKDPPRRHAARWGVCQRPKAPAA